MAFVTLFALPAAACLYQASRSYGKDKAVIDVYASAVHTQ
jgi:hypothetical protein